MNLVGGFYSLVLPGEETGQLMKGLILARHAKGDAVAASIVVDEILGTLSIFTIALGALALTHGFPLRAPIAGAIALMLTLFLIALFVALVPRFHGLARATVERPWLARVPRLDRPRARFAVWLAPFWDRLAGYRREPGAIDEDTLSSYLYTAGLPDPDLLIRTSGEMRVSNFLLWQIAYAEIWVTDVLWPDFRRKHLLQAVADFQKRERRYGGISPA